MINRPTRRELRIITRLRFENIDFLNFPRLIVSGPHQRIPAAAPDPSSRCLLCAKMLALLPTTLSLLCDASSKPASWVHVGPAGYDDGEGGMASAGAAEAAVHIVLVVAFATEEAERRAVTLGRRLVGCDQAGASVVEAIEAMPKEGHR